jgi:hypothetical protein
MGRLTAALGFNSSTPSRAISTDKRANLLHIPTAVSQERFQITLRDLTGRAFILNEITSSMKVSKLKEMFQAKEGIPKHEQKLIFHGKELIDGTAHFYLMPICQQIWLCHEVSVQIPNVENETEDLVWS